ncbi:MAG: glycosyltransferase family 4 protein [Pseudomonadota bacterium]
MGPHLVMVVNDPAFFLSHRLEIGRTAARAGWRVTLVTPPEPAEAVAAIWAEGFGHAAVEMGRGRIAPLRDLATIARLARLYRRLRPDVVHLVTLKPVLFGALAARLAPVPGVVAALSGLGFLFIAEGAKARLVRAMMAPLLRLGLNRPQVAAIFQNTDDRATIEGLGVRAGAGVTMIRGSGTDLARFDPEATPDDPPLVVMPARMLLDKGAAEFVEAARRLRARGIAARFAYLGAPDPANPACVPPETEAAWRAEGTVEFWGHRNDIPACLARATLVVLPSYREGMPKALIEAAAASRAVVTTDAPGCRNAIEPGETGLLVPVRDAGALAEAIAALLADPARIGAMGAAGRRLAERAFRVEAVAARHLALYDQLAGPRCAG